MMPKPSPTHKRRTSTVVAVRMPNRLLTKVKRAAKQMRLSKNGFLTQAAEVAADAALIRAA